MKEHILIVLHQSGDDEIKFTLMDSKHLKYIQDSVATMFKDDDIVDRLMDFIYTNAIGEDINVQTYCTEDWFKGTNIVKVIHVPIC